MRKFLMLAAALMPVLAFGDVPMVLGYQGRLLKPDGTPQTGTKSVIFSIYADPAVGDVLWTETQSLAITNGFVSTFVGAVTVIDPSLFTGRDLYLGVTVDGVELRPRQRIGSVGYAVTAGNGVPPGTILAYAGTTAPAGFLFCDGSAVSRTQYSQLFAAVGTTWGVGNSSSTFNLPDLRGRTTVGSGTGPGLSTRQLGANFGEEQHTLTISEMPSHAHSGTTGAMNTTSRPWCMEWSGSGAKLGMSAHSESDNCRDSDNLNQHSHSFSTGVTGGSASHSIVQPSLAVNYIIKT